uniref:MYM-type zinc finger protein 2 n=1 Tax=Schistosoma japonicum TaxID=6182 RepID=C1L496_SCHJA|nr:MYM-type zinc finger protein 2 [Schistosoma japonicum]
MTAYATSIPAIDPSMGLVELPIDQAGAYVIQDASGGQIHLGSVQGGKSLLKPELAQHLSQHAGYKSNVGRGGFTLSSNDARWVSLNANRGSRNITSRKPLSTGAPPAQSGLLSLGTRYTPSSATVFGTSAGSMSGVNQGITGAGATMISSATPSGNIVSGGIGAIGVDRESGYRLAAAIAGTSGRGRPRGRRPLRGQFPVVPIDMVRQLGIEQQVILQPAAPVAMRNKAVLCRPLSMCRKTQANATTCDNLSQHGVAVQTEKPPTITEFNDKTMIGVEIQTQTVDSTTKAVESEDDDDDDDMVPVGEIDDDQPLLTKSDRPSVSCAETSTADDIAFVEFGIQTDVSDEDELKKFPLVLPIPIPVPIYVPFPVCLYARPVPYAIPYPLPCPVPIPLVFDATPEAPCVEDQGQQVDLITHRTLIDSSVKLDLRDSPAVSATGDDKHTTTQSDDSQSTDYPCALTMSGDEGDTETSKERSNASVKSRNVSSLKRSAPEESSSSSDSWTSESGTTQLTEHNPSFHHHLPTTPVMSHSSGEEIDQSRPPPVKRPRQTLTPVLTSDANYHLKFSYGINAWRHWIQQKSASSSTDKPRSTAAAMQQYSHLYADLLNMNDSDLNAALSQFVREVRKPNNECYVADSIFYLCLGIQEYLNENGRIVNLFGDPAFTGLSRALNEILANFQPRISPEGLLICRIEEEHLWEARQLGSESAEILLFTMLYYNTKHIGLRLGTVHRQLAFSQFQISETAVLCHLPGHMFGEPDDSITTLSLDANPQHPQRCPVKLYKAYFSHCPSELLNSDNVFYLNPLYPPRRDLWFSTDPVRPAELQVILNRIKMVKEIQEAFMNSQPDGGF